MIRYIIKTLLFSFVLIFACSCKEKTHTPKVIYESPNLNKEDNSPKDTEYQIADLPIAFENLDFLLHPVGQIRLSTNTKFSSRSENFSYNLINNLDNDIQGVMQNVLFQEKIKDTLIALTDQNVMLSRVNFLNDFFQKNKQIVFVYEVYDDDSNRDNSINTNDIKSLYVSEEMGKNFKKVSPEMHEAIDWHYYPTLERLYFRTVEDINKNGRFDSSDQIHYYHMSLKDKTFTPVTYNPLN